MCPGPTEPRYFNGARLDGMYPISLLTQGTALNITCVSYRDRLNFGFVGARDSLPHLQNIAVLTGEAFEGLRRLLLPGDTSIQSTGDTWSTAKRTARSRE